VRTIERVGPYDHVLRCAPFSKARIADIGDVPMQSRCDLALCHADIEVFYNRLVGAGVRPLSVGGDHSISSTTTCSMVTLDVCLRELAKLASTTEIGSAAERRVTQFLAQNRTVS
jgi:hypothetical protein